MGVLELTALPSIREEYWVSAVQEADALLVGGGDPLYLCYWMRESGLASLAVPGYAMDDQTAIKVVDGTVEVVSEGHWRLFTP